MNATDLLLSGIIKLILFIGFGKYKEIRVEDLEIVLRLGMEQLPNEYLFSFLVSVLLFPLQEGQHALAIIDSLDKDGGNVVGFIFMSSPDDASLQIQVDHFRREVLAIQGATICHSKREADALDVDISPGLSTPMVTI